MIILSSACAVNPAPPPAPLPARPPPGGDHHDLHHLHAVLPERRVTGQRGRSQGVAGEPGELQEEGITHCAQVTGDDVKGIVRKSQEMM